MNVNMRALMRRFMNVVIRVGTDHSEMLYYNISDVQRRPPRPADRQNDLCRHA